MNKTFMSKTFRRSFILETLFKTSLEDPGKNPPKYLVFYFEKCCEKQTPTRGLVQPEEVLIPSPALSWQICMV